jgi:hypothetical protein
LFGNPAKRVEKVAIPAPVEPAPIKAKQLPMWEVQPTSFDQHVIAYRYWEMAMKQIRGFNTSTNVHLHPADFIIPEPKKPVKDIVDEVLKNNSGWSWEDIKSKRRNRSLVAVRHACMKEVHRQRPDLSFPQLGRIFNRDHSSLLHAVGRLAKSRSNELAGEAI